MFEALYGGRITDEPTPNVTTEAGDNVGNWVDGENVGAPTAGVGRKVDGISVGEVETTATVPPQALEYVHP